MPIYNYKCQKCGYKFEELVFKDQKIKCPHCKSRSLAKLTSSLGMLKKADNSRNGGTCDLSCPTCGG